jgi:toxin ParE1/3/4
VNISWTELAVAHLRSAHDYIAADNPKAAAGVIEGVIAAVEHLERHPLLGRTGRVTNTRELVVPDTPFIVANRQTRGRIEVLAVLHAARKWPENL